LASSPDRFRTRDHGFSAWMRPPPAFVSIGSSSGSDSLSIRYREVASESAAIQSVGAEAPLAPRHRLGVNPQVPEVPQTEYVSSGIVAMKRRCRARAPARAVLSTCRGLHFIQVICFPPPKAPARPRIAPATTQSPESSESPRPPGPRRGLT
jgi:hypothetical protein